MNKSTSFICERTAEYVLIPALKQILQKKYEFVTPIFPWITREGSNISKAVHEKEKFHIVGLYPRRPKLANAEGTEIHIKINREIIAGAKSALEHGIPVVAGCPLANNFETLGSEPDCIWFNLYESTSENYHIEMDNGHMKSLLHKHIFASEEDLLNYIVGNCNLLSLPDALEAFKGVKMKSRGLGYYHPMAFMGGYKPVYFLMKIT
ncbi:MAG: hypothetical protein OEV42_03565 [Deltaproteobacteria bacterium]|nr:hypothetical protein [Deltaproteobacteria bacterium]